MNRYPYDEKALEKEYPLAARCARPEGSIVAVGDVKIGPGTLTLIAGPCAVESREQLFTTAAAVKAAGAAILRGGTYKPRTSPYAFAGLGEEGLRLLAEAGREFHIPVVSEITSAELLPLFDGIDMLQVGARNMQNYALLQALGRQKKPVLLKRGLAATYEEWMASAEYILREGNPNVVLCERGIRSYQSGTRGTLDLAAVPVMQSLTHLPVLVDPSHAAGVSEWVSALGRAAVAAGADGLMVEVHPEPGRALSDGQQALLPEEFARTHTLRSVWIEYRKELPRGTESELTYSLSGSTLYVRGTAENKERFLLRMEYDETV